MKRSFLFSILSGIFSTTLTAEPVQLSFSTPIYSVSEIREEAVPGADTISRWCFDLLQFGTRLSMICQNFPVTSPSANPIAKEQAVKAQDALNAFFRDHGWKDDVVNPLIEIRGFRTDRVWARDVAGIFERLNRGESLAEIKDDLRRRMQVGGENWSALEIYYGTPSSIVLRYMRRGLELERTVEDLKRQLSDKK